MYFVFVFICDDGNMLCIFRNEVEVSSGDIALRFLCAMDEYTVPPYSTSTSMAYGSVLAGQLGAGTCPTTNMQYYITSTSTGIILIAPNGYRPVNTCV